MAVDVTKLGDFMNELDDQIEEAESRRLQAVEDDTDPELIVYWEGSKDALKTVRDELERALDRAGVEL
jgi:uncharacterized protein YdcH (DUF465 family)